MWQTGHPVGSVFGYVAEGLFQAKDFNADGTLVAGYANPGVPVYPGDVKFKDLNNDGKINSDDQTYIGSPNRPTYTFGLNAGIEYKGFFASMNLTGAADRSIMLANKFIQPFSGTGGSLLQFHNDETWTPETAETATLPRLSNKSFAYNSRVSTIYWRDGSYIKLKNVTIGYNITNKKILNAIGASQMSIKMTGYNLLTFDHFKIMDPESNPNVSDTYPVVKIINVGVTVAF
jgi:hypothetical protein